MVNRGSAFGFTCLELIVRLLWSLLMFAYPLTFWCNVVQQQYCTLLVANMCVYALGRLASTADADASISFCIYQGNISLRCTRPFVRFLIVVGIYGQKRKSKSINWCSCRQWEMRESEMKNPYDCIWAGRRVTLHTRYFRRIVPQCVISIFKPLISFVNLTRCESVNGFRWSKTSRISRTSHMKSVTGCAL